MTFWLCTCICLCFSLIHIGRWFKIRKNYHFCCKRCTLLITISFWTLLDPGYFLILILYVFDSRPVESINMSIDPPPLRIWSSVINAAFRVFYKSLCNWVSSIFFKFITLITTLFSNEHTFWSRSLYFFSRVFEL